MDIPPVEPLVRSVSDPIVWTLYIKSNTKASVYGFARIPQRGSKKAFSIGCTFLDHGGKEGKENTFDLKPLKNPSTNTGRFYSFKFDFHFAQGIYHTIFFDKNGKYNYENKRNINAKYNKKPSELSFQILINGKTFKNNSKQKKENNSNEITECIEWLKKHNYQNVKFNNKSSFICGYYNYKNIIDGINPLMNYYENIRNIFINHTNNIFENDEKNLVFDKHLFDIIFDQYMTFDDLTFQQVNFNIHDTWLAKEMQKQILTLTQEKEKEKREGGGGNINGRRQRRRRKKNAKTRYIECKLSSNISIDAVYDLSKEKQWELEHKDVEDGYKECIRNYKNKHKNKNKSNNKEAKGEHNQYIIDNYKKLGKCYYCEGEKNKNIITKLYDSHLYFNNNSSNRMDICCSKGGLHAKINDGTIDFYCCTFRIYGTDGYIDGCCVDVMNNFNILHSYKIKVERTREEFGYMHRLREGKHDRTNIYFADKSRIDSMFIRSNDRLVMAENKNERKKSTLSKQNIINNKSIDTSSKFYIWILNKEFGKKYKKFNHPFGYEINYNTFLRQKQEIYIEVQKEKERKKEMKKNKKDQFQAKK